MPVAEVGGCGILKPINEWHDSANNLNYKEIGRHLLLPSFLENHALNFPASIVALAQAAAKVNGETECLFGWPLSPSKVQLCKCHKCSREFCSTINYRRHKRIHQKSFNIDKDSLMNRELLADFWDKLSLDDSKEILSLKNVAIEELIGSSVISAVSMLIHTPGQFSLPESYRKAGMTLSDIAKGRGSRLHISAQELFSVLDDASEKTFLYSGTALAIQKFVFDGETTKIALEMRNLIACASFMLEKELIITWVADKDAKALRCHKLLVEEEELAQKRQAEILERKRLKKLRQKEQKAKMSTATGKADSMPSPPEPIRSTSQSTGIPSPRSPSELNSNITETSSLGEDLVLLESSSVSDQDQEDIVKADAMILEYIDQGLKQMGNVGQSSTSSRFKVHMPSLHNGHAPGVKDSSQVKNGKYGDQKALRLANPSKIWTPKTRPGDEEAGSGGSLEREYQEQECKAELIGSRMNKFQNKPAKPWLKTWRPVSRPSTGGSVEILTSSGDGEEKTEGSGDVDLQRNAGDLGSESLSGLCLLSVRAAEAFHAQRWKDAIASDHVTFVSNPRMEPSTGRDCY